MVATSERLTKTKVSSTKKVSKPLMEKKRRARINTCLDQLKTILESFYASNIRKRKLEKADILELTVKHLKHLQKTEKGFVISSGIADYQAGVRSCLANVNQFMVMADANTASRFNTVAHLSNNLFNTGTHLSNSLLCAGAQAPESSTVDSDTSRALAERNTLLAHAPSTSARTFVSSSNATIKMSRSIDRNPNAMSNRTEVFDKDKTLGNGLFEQPKHVPVNRTCVGSPALQQNYWRPW
ncbi:hairy-related 3 [Brachyhypopomus gauderio]|uniref:hairy-related 3 n=1 Tax=Brachyhypopomus gauderio TaxID=698409 RepID=UPI00404134B5